MAMQIRRVTFNPGPPRSKKGEGGADEGDYLPRHMSFTRVPMRPKQVPIAVEVLPDEHTAWTLADVLFGCNRHGGQIEPIHIWPIELC